MSPHRSNARGTFRIDRILPTVGRIARASGTSDPSAFLAIVGERRPGRPRIPGMLDLLHRPLGRDDLLRAIRDGQLVAAEVYQAWQAGTLAAVQVAGAGQLLKPALEAWLDSLPNSETRRGYRGELRRAGALRAGLPLHELPGLLRAYRQRCQARGVWRAFNLARAAAQAFVRDTLGQRATAYAEIEDLRPLARTAARRLPPAPTHAEFLARCARLPVAAARCAQGMAYSGMNPKEFWGAWTAHPDRIHIEGTKRVGRVRDVPLIVPISRPTIARITFRRQLANAGDGWSPKHFRNFYARWMAEAGIAEVWREMHLGHGVRRIADLYPRAEVERYLVEHAERMRAFLGLTTKDLLRVERAG